MTFFLAALGLFGFASQVVLLRQFMAVFAGNELTLGIALASWLLWEALGAHVAGRRCRAAGASRSFPLPSVPSPSKGEGEGEGESAPPTPCLGQNPWLVLLSVLGSLVSFLLVVLCRRILGLAPGETLSIPLLAAVAFALTALPALTHSVLFVTAAQRLGSGGRAYLWRGLGTVSGGLLLALAFLLGAPALPVLALSAVPLAVLMPARTRLHWLSVPLLVVLAAVGTRVERTCWQLAWPGQSVTRTFDSPYGRTVRLDRAGSTTILHDGVPVYSTPALDPLAAEELVAVPLAAADHPRSLLFVGQGLGPLAAAALRWPGLHVTMVQPDARLTRAIADSDTTAARQLASPRVRHVTADPISFLRATSDSFDCIILLDPAPATLAASRFFTTDFFRLCHSRLAPAGALAIPGPGDPSALSPDVAALLSFRRSGLLAVFPHVAALPLDFPLILASSSPPALSDSSLLAPHSSLLTRPYLSSLLSSFRQEQLSAALARSRPHARSELFLNLVRENRLASATFARLYSSLGGIPPSSIWLLTALLAAFALTLAVRRTGSAGRGYAILTSGFAGAALPVLVLFAWQLRFGSVYSGLVLLLASFMAGAVTGSRLGTRLHCRWFLASDALLVLLAAALPLVSLSPAPCFILLDFLVGAVLGLQFSLATSADVSLTGRVAALDLAGGFAGSLMTALVLVPVFGLTLSALAVLLLKLGSTLGLSLSLRFDSGCRST